MVRYFSLLLFICLASLMAAQDFDLLLSDVYKKDNGWIFGGHLHSTDEHHFVYFYQERGIKILKMDDQFNLLLDDEIQTESKSISHQKLISHGDQFIWVTRKDDYRDKTFRYEITTLDYKGNFGRPKSLVDFRYKNKDRIPVFNAVLSQDSSKLLIALEVDYDRGDEYSAYYTVYDYDMNRLYEGDLLPELSQEKVEMSNWTVSNTGIAYSTAKYYHKSPNKEEIKVKGKYVQAYDQLVYQYRETGSEYLVFEEENNFIRDIIVSCNKSGDAFVAYSYCYRLEDPNLGYVVLKLNPDNMQIINEDQVVFNEELLSTYSSNEVLSNNRGTGLRPEYKLTGALPQPDGSILFEVANNFIEEYRDFNTWQNAGVFPYGYGVGWNRMPVANQIIRIFHYGTPFIIQAHESGRVEKATLVQKQYVVNDPLTGGNFIDKQGEKTIALYNSYDSAEGINTNRRGRTTGRNTYFMVTHIDENNRIETALAFDAWDESFLPIISSIKSLGNGRFFISGIDPRRDNKFRFGIFSKMQ